MSDSTLRLYSDVTTTDVGLLFKIGDTDFLKYPVMADINKVLGIYLYSEKNTLILVLGLVLFIAMVLAIYLVKPVKDN